MRLCSLYFLGSTCHPGWQPGPGHQPPILMSSTSFFSSLPVQPNPSARHQQLKAAASLLPHRWGDPVRSGRRRPQEAAWSVAHFVGSGSHPLLLKNGSLDEWSSWWAARGRWPGADGLGFSDMVSWCGVPPWGTGNEGTLRGRLSALYSSGW